MISREKIFRYAKKKYGVEPDYPLPIAPSFPVLRHADNRKWFALIMDVPKEKLGLHGADRVDIINVKLSDPLLVDLLVHQEGYFRGYHIRGGNWVSILLDGIDRRGHHGHQHQASRGLQTHDCGCAGRQDRNLILQIDTVLS